MAKFWSKDSQRLLRRKTTEPSYEVCSTEGTSATQLRAALTVGQVATVAWVSNYQSKVPAYGFLGSLISWYLMSSPLAAQVTPDGSLGTETNTENNVTEITGGTSSGSNLFHSFQGFSVETGATAYFNNGADVSNIIGRVTGSSSSNIDGLIRANGDANLLLINPNGITLGSNARLDIGGSFLGSTAESVVFADGTVFNTDLDQPLLTVTAPVGLQLGQNSAAIEVSGAANLNQGLETSPGNTFALVGNGITFDGGVVTAESGRIDLGSVGAGQVSISEIAAGWQLGYAEVTQFASLQLLGGSALLNPNKIANSTGGIQVQGSNILLERSQIAAQTLADAPGGDIVVNASDLALSGTAAAGENSSQISNNVVSGATGQGGAIDITTGKLDINPRSFIDSSIFGAGSAGDIKITAQEINLNGAGFLEFQQKYRIDALEGTLRPGSRITGIFAGTATTGTAGNITIKTDSLNLTDGAIIFTPVYTAGHGGNINVTAKDINLSASAIQNGGGVGSLASASLGNINLNSDRLKVSDGATVINLTFGDVSGGSINVLADSIDLSGSRPESIIGTGLFTNTTLGSGEGGDINLDASTIKIKDAVIASNSGAILPDGTVIPFGGLGGDVKIQASKSIEASGIVFNTDNPQLSVGAAAGIGTSTYSAADGGNLRIDTGKLTVRNGANLTSSTFNSGDGGQLTINAADSVELIGFATETGITRGGLFASSGGVISSGLEVTGTSGNISITSPNLTVRDGAIIDVQSNSLGDAGSIDLVSDFILLANEGALSATTKDGAGGNIQIDTKVLELNRGLINASVLGKGTGGNIEISAQDSVNITGSGFEQLQSSLFDPKIITPEFLASLSIDKINDGILAASIGAGNAGRINIQTTNLSMKQGGLIATATAGNGAAGSILLNTSESLVVDGSFISNNTLFSGEGGNITVDTNRLEILQGGRITASTLGRGNGGNVAINASESAIITGNVADSVSNISVGARLLPTTTGNGGDLTINTPQLKIDDRAALSIGSTGTGDAGSLEVNADSIMIDRQGSISADTQSGRGGNIELNAENIIWRGESSTTATARKTGNGGNIKIQTNNFIALESSRVTADAFKGRGGNIQVDTQGLFICESCQVTASSELGLDGIVDIETLEPTTTLNSLDLRQQPTQIQEEVAVACPSEPGNTTSQLTITGRGGLPNRPQEPLNARSLVEFTSPAATSKTPMKPTQQTILPPPARSWYRQPNGQVVLTAQTAVGSGSPYNSAINAVDCHN